MVMEMQFRPCDRRHGMVHPALTEYCEGLNEKPTELHPKEHNE
jgi:hypothetical protein